MKFKIEIQAEIVIKDFNKDCDVEAILEEFKKEVIADMNETFGVDVTHVNVDEIGEKPISH